MTVAANETSALDLSDCAREPIHIPGAIQPHGILIACRRTPDLIIRHASRNVEDLVLATDGALPGLPLAEVLPELRPLLLGLESVQVGDESQFLQTVALQTTRGPALYDLALHRAGDLDIFEFEETSQTSGSDVAQQAANQRLRLFLSRLQSMSDVSGLCAMAASEVRQITQFDRVLVYRFDEDWNGTVIAEDGNGVLPSYLDLRFPASDIPAQARDLYRRNRLRIIPDASYEPVPVLPVVDEESGRPLDMSFAQLRAVSPVHLEYMRNMGTLASMSVSIIAGGQLWGLISCHNKSARRVPLASRNACDFLAQVLAIQISAREQAADAERRMKLAAVSTRLLGYMAEQERFSDGLIEHPDDLAALTGASGAALISGLDCWLVGVTPTEAEVRQLYDWLSLHHGGVDVFATDALSLLHPPAAAYADKASGLLSISISKKYARHILWFRPEVVETVRWGGDPSKVATANRPGEPNRLHPRKSFEAWREIVRGRSAPWSAPELDVVKELRNAILGIVLRRAEELASLSEELQRSNRELESFSYSVSHDLRAPFRHIVGFAELLKKRCGPTLDAQAHRYVDTIIESAFSAGTLVDNLLSFSQMSRSSLSFSTVNMNVVVDDVRRRVERDVPAERTIVWDVPPLGTVFVDVAMLRLAVENLLSNAVKYTRDRNPARIEIGVSSGDGERIFHVRDNGIGFDMAYVGKLFGVFQRLHRIEEFEGTGIGLANVRRIIERHGGRTWAEGVVGEGATFYFTLPERGAST